MKYDKIVAITKEKSRQKVEITKKHIQVMLENEERVTVEVLRQRTGFAKSFFYRNEEVRKVVETARSRQTVPCNSIQIIRGIEAEEKIIELKISITKLEMQNERLVKENEELKRRLEAQK
ncbi:hypothetical protein HMPREF9457_00807 [Dorea formicigenerans 4_6_53AFAA]|nr:hypothetical protein HMPREF9457_00807 [Dorea formicigenerans 4_6_53AFAA]